MPPTPTRRVETATGRCRIGRQRPVAESAAPYRAFLLGSALGECPVWCERHGVLLALDLERRALHVIDPDSAECRTLPLPGRATALVPADGNRLVAAVEDRLMAVALDDAELRVVGELARLDVSVGVFNDAKADRAGRLWVGSRHRDRLAGGGALWCYEPEHGLTMADSGYTVANGIACSPSGDHLHVADSRQGAIFRYALGPDGAQGRRHLFAQFGAEDGMPDGLTGDTEGGVWTALWGGGAIRRYAADGTLERAIELPVSHPTSCMFGGRGLATLFVTSAAPAAGRTDGGVPAPDGAVFAIDTGFAGVPETPARLRPAGPRDGASVPDPR